MVELCAITAVAENGHSQLFLSQRDEAQIGFTALDGRFFVTSVAAEHAAVLGAHLVATDGHPDSEVRTELRKLHGACRPTGIC